MHLTSPVVAWKMETMRTMAILTIRQRAAGCRHEQRELRVESMK
jgi:hypothetical protein